MSCTLPALPRVSREQWSSHPRFPAQVLLLGSHENFRRVSRHVAELVASEDVVGAALLFRRWMSAMRGHEAYEEQKLYPFLARRFCVDTQPAEQGHVALHEAEREVRGCFERHRRSWPAGHSNVAVGSAAGSSGPSDVRTLTRALRIHHERLIAHLSLEEDLVIPLLLALSPEEFAEYYDSRIETLLRRLPQRSNPQCP